MVKINNIDLYGFNSYHLHSVAKAAYFPETIEDFESIIPLPNLVVLGGGCNVILSKQFYENENFVIIKDNFAGIDILGGGMIKVQAGTDLKDLSLFAYQHKLTGLEYYYDIPGCVGGATVMNAGCQGVSFGDFISSIRYFDLEEKKIKEISGEDAKWEYRGNVFGKKKVIILEVVLELVQANASDIWAKMIANQNDRWKKQPRNYPSAGSVFKRPTGHYVGPMITEVGLKGYRIGGAEISSIHAGFIVNLGSATADDIISLIRLVQARVKEKFEVNLELEQRII